MLRSLLYISMVLVTAVLPAEYDEILDFNYLNDAKKVPCIIGMIEKHFTVGHHQHGSLVLVSVPNRSGIISRLVLAELNDSKELKVSIMVSNPSRVVRGEMIVPSKVKCYVLILRVMSEFSKVIETIRGQPSWNPTAPFLVIFLEMMSEFALMVHTKSVMQALFDHSVVDVNVISTRSNSYVMQSQTWYPYEGQRCGENVLKVRTVSECEYFGKDSTYDDSYYEENEDEEDEDSEELFLLQYDFSNLGPKVPSNLNGCPITVMASTLEPFVIEGLHGFEVIMTKVISEQMNLNPIIKYSDPNLALKTMTSNNVTGYYADLINHKVDIMIGGMFDNKINQEILSSSLAYIEDDYTWCVPRSGNAPSWMNVFTVFDFGTWMIAFVFIFVTGAMLYALLRYEGVWKENYWWATMVAMAISINASGPTFIRKVKPVYMRLFLMGFFLYGMHFNAAYQSYLVSVMTRPRFKAQIDTVEKAINRGFVFAGGENVLEYLYGNNWLSQYITSNYQTCADLDTCLAELNSDEVLKAVATSRKHAISSRHVDNEQIFCFGKTENIHIHGIKLLVRKDYHLLPKLNDLIHQVTESGLFDKWQHEAETLKDSLRSKQAKSVMATAPQPLQLHHIQGAYGLLLLGSGIALLAFIFEWIVFALKHWKRIVVLDLIEKFFFV